MLSFLFFSFTFYFTSRRFCSVIVNKKKNESLIIISICYYIMDNYFELLPSELILEIFWYIDDYLVAFNLVSSIPYVKKTLNIQNLNILLKKKMRGRRLGVGPSERDVLYTLTCYYRSIEVYRKVKEKMEYFYRSINNMIKARYPEMKINKINKDFMTDKDKQLFEKSKYSLVLNSITINDYIIEHISNMNNYDKESVKEVRCEIMCKYAKGLNIDMIFEVRYDQLVVSIKGNNINLVTKPSYDRFVSLLLEAVYNSSVNILDNFRGGPVIL